MACSAVDCFDGSVRGFADASFCVCNPLRLCCGSYANGSDGSGNGGEHGHTYVYRMGTEFGHSVRRGCVPRGRAVLGRSPAFAVELIALPMLCVVLGRALLASGVEVTAARALPRRAAQQRGPQAAPSESMRFLGPHSA